MINITWFLERRNYVARMQTNSILDFLSVSYEPSPVPSKFKEPGYIIAEVLDRKHGRVIFLNVLLSDPLQDKF